VAEFLRPLFPTNKQDELTTLRAKLAEAEENAEYFHDQWVDAEAELEDWRESAERAAGEMCGDEKHCTCVPVLRAKLADGEKENRALRELLRRVYQCEIDQWMDSEVLIEMKAALDTYPPEEKGGE